MASEHEQDSQAPSALIADRLYSVRAILLDLQLPSFDTLIYMYNLKKSFSMQFTCSGDAVVKYLVSTGNGMECVCVFTTFLLLFAMDVLCLE